MNSQSGSVKRISADKLLDEDGQPKAFLLKNGTEKITLEAGKAWAQLDTYKWVTRGLIEEPSGFHVLPNGSVQIHGEEIELQNPLAMARLEERINQHLDAAAPKPPRPATVVSSTPKQGPNKVQFKVRLDRMGHLMVAYVRGAERMETGIRGLAGLIRNGLMLKPQSVHIDPLLSYVEIDGVRFDSNPAGAEALEKQLNSLYAPVFEADSEVAIEIRANPGAASGFDIHFVTFRAGARFEVKGHLCQEHLDTLQDPAKCQLLRPGTVLRISPPHLIIRRRRRDGSEEKIPELPDVHYLRVTATELQRILNHPVIRQGTAAAHAETNGASEQGPPEITELRILRSSQNKMLPGLEIVTARGSHTNAFTHHNVAELRQAGVFRSNLEVLLSLDNRTLSIFNNETQQEDRIHIDDKSSDADLGRAGEMLTAALKPPVSPAGGPGEIPVSVANSSQPLEQAEIAPERGADLAKPLTPPAPVTEIQPVSLAVTESPPEANPEIRALFSETDAVRINVEIFRRLEACLGLRAQHIHLSLERVFQDREFEIISFSRQDISDILEIRSEDFTGFYLSHINERKVLLDYAYQGKRIEWGPQRCLLQGSVTTDPEEFSGSALLGMALIEANQFVFVVSPPFKQWINAREKLYRGTAISFVTVGELSAAPEKYPLVWPVP